MTFDEWMLTKDKSYVPTDDSMSLRLLRECWFRRDAEIARLKTVPMRYRRMAFNAQLQDEVVRLEQENDQLRAQIKQKDAEIAELVAALSRLTRCAPATVECENMHHRNLDQHGYDKTCHLVSRYAEALCNAQELLVKVRKP